MRASLASLAVYTVAAAVMGRNVLVAPGAGIANDPGDPLLNAAILAWTATHVPWTDAWYQFPIFHPIADALTLSEHLLGLSVIASPIYWVTGDAAATYNLTLLLTYPLCGLAMYALVWRLTSSVPASFLAGLAFAFAPYRVSHLPHIQVLAVFWAPLALLGLHEFLQGQRRFRWLALFAVAWMLQGAANGYFLVYFSVVVGLWVLWFVIGRGAWRDAAIVVAAMLTAAIPLAPVLVRYLRAQYALGLSRNLGEIAAYGADIAAPLCAPDGLTFWGWLRVACAQEGELFPGAALVALCAGASIYASVRSGARQGGTDTNVVVWRESPGLRLVRRIALGIGIAYLAITAVVTAAGPFSLDLGWFRASASSFDKPLSVALYALLAAFVLSPSFRGIVCRGSPMTFYATAALVCWVLSWGPFPRFFGADALYQAPFAWLLQLPGVENLRVPARFWMMAAMCLAIVLGLALARVLPRLAPRTRAFFVAAAAAVLLMDGWTTIRIAPLPGELPDEIAARTDPLLVLPAGTLDADVGAVYRAVDGGWRAINGFSGHEPGYYEALRSLARDADERLLAPFVAREDIQVVVNGDDPERRAMVERQRGAVLLAERDGRLQYRIARRDQTDGTVAETAGEPVPILQVQASCSPEGTHLAHDGDLATRWVCGVQDSDHWMLVELERDAQIGGVVHALGTLGADFPRHLVVETSLDGAAWDAAWEGSPAARVLTAALTSPRATRVHLDFTPRRARFVRLRQTGRDERNYWSIAELAILTRSPFEARMPWSEIQLKRFFSSTHSATTPSFHPIFFPSS